MRQFAEFERSGSAYLCAVDFYGEILNQLARVLLRDVERSRRNELAGGGRVADRYAHPVLIDCHAGVDGFEAAPTPYDIESRAFPGHDRAAERLVVNCRHKPLVRGFRRQDGVHCFQLAGKLPAAFASFSSRETVDKQNVFEIRVFRLVEAGVKEISEGRRRLADVDECRSVALRHSEMRARFVDAVVRRQKLAQVGNGLRSRVCAGSEYALDGVDNIKELFFAYFKTEREIERGRIIAAGLPLYRTQKGE